MPARASIKRCRVCGIVKEAAEFHLATYNAGGLAHRCKSCQKIYAFSYRQKRIASMLDPAGRMRQCSDCAQTKPLIEFHIQPLGKLGRAANCKQCVRVRVRIWREENPEQRQAQRLKLYNLSPEEFRKIAAAQNGRCAICGQVPSDKPKSGGLHVDHCHKTGVVRGLLCTSCNRGLGFFGDDEDRLRSAIHYLRRRFPTPQLVGQT